MDPSRSWMPEGSGAPFKDFPLDIGNINILHPALHENSAAGSLQSSSHVGGSAALVATHSGLKSSCLKFYGILAANHVCMFTVGKRTTNRKWVEEINEPSVGAL